MINFNWIDKFVFVQNLVAFDNWYNFSRQWHRTRVSPTINETEEGTQEKI